MIEALEEVFGLPESCSLASWPQIVSNYHHHHIHRLANKSCDLKQFVIKNIRTINIIGALKCPLFMKSARTTQDSVGLYFYAQ